MSVPWSGDRNVAHRHLRVGLAGRPAGSTLKSVRVDLLNADTQGVLMTIMDGPPVGALVEQQAPDRLRVRVTNGSENGSSVGAVSPPPAHRLAYRVRVQLATTGGDVQSQKDTSTLYALWRMPPLFQRTGCRDAGGDDWCARGAHVWMQANASLLTRINDISGEHARNLGHASHRDGTDIDMFQFAVAGNGGGSGSANYLALAAQVRRALDGSESDRQAVESWIAANRAGLEALEAKPEVDVIYVGIGNAAGQALPTGWLRDLLFDGEVTAGSKSVTLTIGAWANATKTTPFTGHNDHHHVSLAPSVAPGP